MGTPKSAGDPHQRRANKKPLLFVGAAAFLGEIRGV
jgi:hypothetical protein